MRIDTPSNLSKKPPETVHYQGRTPALQQIESLFDHLVGGGDERRWHGEAERPGGLKVDHKLELGRRLNGQVGGFVALEDTIGIRRRTPKLTERVNSVGQQAADVSEETGPIDGRDTVASSQQSNLRAMADREGIRYHD